MKYASALALGAALFVSPVAADTFLQSNSASYGTIVQSGPVAGIPGEVAGIPGEVAGIPGEVAGIPGEVVRAGGTPSSARYSAAEPNFFAPGDGTRASQERLAPSAVPRPLGQLASS